MSLKELEQVADIDDHLSEVINARIDDIEDKPSMTKILSTHAELLKDNVQFNGFDLYGEDFENQNEDFYSEELEKNDNLDENNEVDINLDSNNIINNKAVENNDLSDENIDNEINDDDFDFFAMELEDLESDIKKMESQKNKDIDDTDDTEETDEDINENEEIDENNETESEEMDMEAFEKLSLKEKKKTTSRSTIFRRRNGFIRSRK